MLLEFYPLKSLENHVYDILARFRRSPAERQVVFVAIDDRSIQQIGSWPWPRDYIADVIVQLSRHGTHTLGISLLYPEMEFNYAVQEILKIKQIPWKKILAGKNKKLSKTQQKNLSIINDSLKEAEKHLNQDTNLVKAVKSTRNVVLPIQFILDGPEDETSLKVDGWLRLNTLDLTPNPDGKATSPEKAAILPHNFATKQITAQRVIQPFTELSTKAGALGHINLIADDDNIVRSIPLFIHYQDRDFPSFALQVTRKYIGVGLKSIKAQSNKLRLKHLRIPTDRSYRMLIDFSAQDQNIRKYSFADVLSGTIAGREFQDKLVLIGITATGIAPRYKTTLQAKLTDIEITALAINNIINQNHISRPAWAFALEAMVLLYFMFFLLFVIPKVNLRIGMLILGIFLITWMGIASMLFIAYGYWFHVMAPVILSVIGFGIARHHRVAAEMRNKQLELSKAFGLSLQSQGMLDMAFEKFLNCPIEDKSVKELLYNLGLDFERKRMHNKAIAVFRHILKTGRFKDIAERIENLKIIENAVVLPTGSTSQKGGLVLDQTTAKPTLGRYEIIKELGQGAMGTVYQGKDPSINREVAIKTLNYADIESTEIEEVKSQFFREAEAAGMLSHPNIVTIYDVGEDHDMAYIAMELLRGKDLTHLCQKQSLLSTKRVLGIVTSVAQALDYAHRQEVVHRDIKPANIILLDNDQVKVADFGIARVMSASSTKTGVIFGTPNYMSPEQVAGKKVDGRSDLFSLGVVFYELLSGQKPFQGDNLNTLMYAIANGTYTPLNEVKTKAPACCEEIIDKLLTKGVSKRFQTAAQVAKQLDECRDLIG
jgi:serine/threonine-protein kinase